MKKAKDVLYVLKNGYSEQELRYSVRSICENLRFGNLVIVGGCPDYIQPDFYIEHQQMGDTRYKRVAGSILKACEDPRLSQEFYLFNDDFFILKKMRDIPAMASGTIYHTAQVIERRHGGQTAYTRALRHTAEVLKGACYDRLNYAVHAPMPCDKDKLRQTLREMARCESVRNAYGNMWKVGGVIREDVKVRGRAERPDEDADLISTSDEAFQGVTGAWIRDRFTEPCKYELFEL